MSTLSRRLVTGDRVHLIGKQSAGTVVEIPEGRGYVFVQWDSLPEGNLAGEWPKDLEPCE